MTGSIFNIFIEIDAVLKTINEENYDSYNQLFLDMLSDINRIKRKNIFILRDHANEKCIKDFFHEDLFDYFEIVLMEDLDKLKTYINEKNIDVKSSFAVLTLPDTIQAFREIGIFTSYLQASADALNEKKAFQIVDYQKNIFRNLFNINYENLIFECNRFNKESEDEENENDI